MNLFNRLRKTYMRKDDVSMMRSSTFDIKYVVSRRYGDWLMREARLIRRLSPRANKTYVSRAAAPVVPASRTRRRMAVLGQMKVTTVTR